ncbi:MAG: TetR/AcrR family transcriptional regulator [Alphaproteobacteria bacterium]|nr:MAG: TetR/AcrR family transcriptional regulator [Alphaproteobacteria bacterium]
MNTASATELAPTRKSAPRARDADLTRKRILAAATAEFGRKGLGGARVDEIARRSKSNQRMIYHYFGSKELLFTAVLEAAYSDIRAAEQKRNYYLEHPKFLSLVNSANLHRARHLKGSQTVREVMGKFVQMVKAILDRGAAMGEFREGIDPVQLNITIAAIGYYYLTNRFTGSIIYDRDLMAPDNLDQRLAFNLETILRLVRRES